MRRQDPRKLYTAYGNSAGMKAWDGKPMPTWDQLNSAVRTHWTITALHCVTGHDYAQMEPALERLVREVDNVGDKLSGPHAELSWSLRLWGRMAAAPGPRLLPVRHPDPHAIVVALRFIGVQHTEMLLGPLHHPGEAEHAGAFMRQLGILSVAALGLRMGYPSDRWPVELDVAAVSQMFERIASQYEHLEDDGQQRGEARLFRAAARLITDYAALGPRSPDRGGSTSGPVHGEGAGGPEAA